MMQKDKTNIVFVCTGNTCRSPMAEAIFYSKTSDYSENITVSSCGLGVSVGDSATDNAVRVMSDRGLDLSCHRSRQINQYIIDDADFVICLSQIHFNYLLPVIPEKLILLGNGISDPFGGDIEVYEQCASEIETAIDALLDSDVFLDIVPMEDIDSDKVAAIESETFSIPWSKDAFLTQIRKDYGVAYTARYLNSPVGYICCDNSFGEVFVGTVAVKKEMRGRGIGDKLINRVADYCVTENCGALSLEVRVSNTPAINLYLKNGFVNLGIRRNFYSKPDEDAYIMTKFFDGDK